MHEKSFALLDKIQRWNDTISSFRQNGEGEYYIEFAESLVFREGR